jgi:hypothetical protein
MEHTARDGAITMMMNRRSCIVRPKLVGCERRAIATWRCWTVFSMHLKSYFLPHFYIHTYTYTVFVLINALVRLFFD